MRHKFDLCYLMAKEGIAFEKYVVLYELEARHGADLSYAYKTAPSAKLFTHYIAESQCQQLLQLQTLSETMFYSFLMDGITDAGNVEQESSFFCVRKMTRQKRSSRSPGFSQLQLLKRLMQVDW